MNKRLILTICVIFIAALGFCATDEAITFSGGYTKVLLREGKEVVSLSQGAKVSVGSIQLEADTVELSGTGYRYVRCTGKVVVTDASLGITLRASKLFYDRTDELIIVDGWVELQDTKNEVIASAGWMEYDMRNAVMRMQMHVRLLKHTDKGAMECRAQNVVFDRDEEQLSLNGGASVLWNKDTYQASLITVDLKTDQIVMDGSIQGVIHG